MGRSPWLASNQISVPADMVGSGIVLLLLLVSGGTALQHGVGRIVQGSSVEIERHPYQVSILDKATMALRCGGAIISWGVVLTAAKCVTYNPQTKIKPSNLVVRAGSSSYQEGGTLHYAYGVQVHDKFQEPNYSLGIISVMPLFDFSKKTTSPIALPHTGMSLKPGTRVTVTGWGRTGILLPYAEQLQAASFEVPSWNTCRAKIGNWFHESMFCVLSTNAAVCHKDHGAPAVQGFYLYGIMSHFLGGCYVGKYYRAVFSDLSEDDIRDWIRLYIDL